MKITLCRHVKVTICRHMNSTLCRSNIVTLADYRQSLPEMRDNNNGVYLQNRETHQPLRIWLNPPVLDDLGHLSDSDELDSLDRIERPLTNTEASGNKGASRSILKNSSKVGMGYNHSFKDNINVTFRESNLSADHSH